MIYDNDVPETLMTTGGGSEQFAETRGPSREVQSKMEV